MCSTIRTGPVRPRSGPSGSDRIPQVQIAHCGSRTTTAPVAPHHLLVVALLEALRHRPGAALYPPPPPHLPPLRRSREHLPCPPSIRREGRRHRRRHRQQQRPGDQRRLGLLGWEEEDLQSGSEGERLGRLRYVLRTYNVCRDDMLYVRYTADELHSRNLHVHTYTTILLHLYKDHGVHVGEIYNSGAMLTASNAVRNDFGPSIGITELPEFGCSWHRWWPGAFVRPS
jgi:hypothetical protein